MVEMTLTWGLLAAYCGFLLYLVRQTTPNRVSPPEFLKDSPARAKPLACGC